MLVTIIKYLYTQFPNLLSKIFCHPDDKPVEHLNKRDDAKSKTQSKQTTNIGHEVSICHPSHRLKILEYILILFI